MFYSSPIIAIITIIITMITVIEFNIGIDTARISPVTVNTNYSWKKDESSWKNFAPVGEKQLN